MDAGCLPGFFGAVAGERGYFSDGVLVLVVVWCVGFLVAYVLMVSRIFWGCWLVVIALRVPLIMAC